METISNISYLTGERAFVSGVYTMIAHDDDVMCTNCEFCCYVKKGEAFPRHICGKSAKWILIKADID